MNEKGSGSEISDFILDFPPISLINFTELGPQGHSDSTHTGIISYSDSNSLYFFILKDSEFSCIVYLPYNHTTVIVITKSENKYFIALLWNLLVIS